MTKMVNTNVFLSEQKSDYLINIYQKITITTKIISNVLKFIQFHIKPPQKTVYNDTSSGGRRTLLPRIVY